MAENEQTDRTEADPDFLRLQRWYRVASQHGRQWRTDAEKDYAFVAGDQWSEEDKAVLKDQLRPALTFNRVSPVIDSVSGYEVQNRQEVRYLPRQMGKVQVNEVLTAAAKWFRDQSFAEDEESDAFLDAVTCGIGWVETRPDYEEDAEGKPVDQRVDPLEMSWDPSAKRKNLEDRRFQFRTKKYPKEDAEAMFPDVEPEDLHAAWADEASQGTEPHQQQEAQFYRDDQSGDGTSDRKEVTIVQAQWWDKEAYYKVADPQTGKIVDFPAEKFHALTKQAKKFGVPMPRSVKSTKRVYKQAFLGSKMLDDGDSPYPKGFTINPITGKRDRNKNSFYGLVRSMRDPQEWANKFFSSLIHQFATSGKGLLAETTAVENVRRFEDEYADATAVKWLSPGGLGKIQEMTGAQINAGVVNMMEYAIGSIRDVTGVNIELMGQAERDQPGVLEFQRRQAGLTILAGYFDSLRRFRKTQGHILLYYIQNLFSDNRLIRIDGEDGAKYIPLIRDPTIADYDVIVDEAPSSPNQKEHVWGMLIQMMPVLGNIADPVIWGELIKYSPLPSSLTEKINQYLQQRASQPPQMAPEKQADLQIKAMTAQSNVERNRAGAIRDLSQAGIQGPGPGEQLMSQAVDALIQSGQSAQDHRQTVQQQQLDHRNALVQNAQQHIHALGQAAQQASLAPPTQQ